MDAASSSGSTLVISLEHASRLVGEGPPDLTGREHWTVTGEAAIASVLRRLHPGAPELREVVVRIPSTALPAGGAAALVEGMRRWCEAKRARNASVIRTLRRIGVRTLAGSVLFLTASLGVAALLQTEEPAARLYLLRNVLAEGAVIAGWVSMWRPVELLMFDPLAHLFENRLLRKAMSLNWMVEPISSPVGTPV